MSLGVTPMACRRRRRRWFRFDGGAPPLFFAILVGTALISTALTVVGLARWQQPGSGFLVAGGLLYLLGVIGVTMVFNVPQ